MAYEYENKKTKNKYTTFLKRDDAFVIIFTRIGYVILPILLRVLVKEFYKKDLNNLITNYFKICM